MSVLPRTVNLIIVSCAVLMGVLGDVCQKPIIQQWCFSVLQESKVDVRNTGEVEKINYSNLLL